MERNDGTIDKPYFMSRGLMRILGLRKKRRDPVELWQNEKNVQHYPDYIM